MTEYTPLPVVYRGEVPLLVAGLTRGPGVGPGLSQAVVLVAELGVWEPGAASTFWGEEG